MYDQISMWQGNDKPKVINISQRMPNDQSTKAKAQNKHNSHKWEISSHKGIIYQRSNKEGMITKGSKQTREGGS